LDLPNLEFPKGSLSTPGVAVAAILRLPISPAAPITPAQTASHRFGRGCSTGRTLLLFFGSFERAYRDQTLLYKTLTFFNLKQNVII